MNPTLGRYIPGNSFIHRLDPRFKIIAMIILMVAAFWRSSGFFGLLIIAIVVIIGMLNAKIRLLGLLKMFKYMWLMFIILFLFNIFTVNSGVLLVNVDFVVNWLGIDWHFPIYLDAILNVVYVIARLLLMLAISLLLTATTKPMELTYGLEYLLKPLRVIRFPVHEVAMMISIALRFIPTLLEEAQRIMKAQASRGVDIQEGKFFERVKAITSLLVPLFVSAFQRSEELADAMEARAYNPSARRTRYRILKSQRIDYIALTLCISLFTGVIFIGIYHQQIMEVISLW